VERADADQPSLERLGARGVNAKFGAEARRAGSARYRSIGAGFGAPRRSSKWGITGAPPRGVGVLAVVGVAVDATVRHAMSARPSEDFDGAIATRGGFFDAALEAGFWRHEAERRLVATRRSIALLIACTTAFAPVDALVFPDRSNRLLVLRLAMVVAMLAAAPIVYGARARERLVDRSQEVLLYLTVVACSGFLAMHALVIPGLDELRALFTLIPAIFSLACVLGVSGLRVRYAAPVALVGSAIYLGVLASSPNVRPQTLVAALTFTSCACVIGLWVGWSVESAARRDFLRTREIERARERSQRLLLNLMPAAFAERLKAEQDALERYAEVTVIFATIAGFEAATAGLPALEAVALLDRVVSELDELARDHRIERIKTIGATYMAVAGVPASEPDDARRAAEAALAMRDRVRSIAARERLALELRVGLATGPVVAGVIGRTRLAFDCWGDTANLAARLDTHGAPERVHVSDRAAERLRSAFAIEPRGLVPIKGKGSLPTHWLEPPVRDVEVGT
jgi:class 3 adenylate cyclase